MTARVAGDIGVVDATSDLSFAANLYDDRGKTIALVNFRYYPEQAVTQEEVRDIAADDLRAFDEGLEAATRESYKGTGAGITKWMGTRRVMRGSGCMLISEYSRSEIESGGPFRVRLVRVLNGGASFTFTVSYAERLSQLLRPICDASIASLRF